MKWLCAVVLVFVVAAASASAGAQKRPDFSGKWEEDESQRKSPPSTPSSGGIRAVSGPQPPLVIIHTSQRVTIERTFMEQVTRMSYDIDGRENVNRTGAQVHTTRSRWEEGKFITEGTIFQVTSLGETSWKLKEVRWLTPKGEMAVERTQVDEDGVAATVFRVFRKK